MGLLSPFFSGVDLAEVRSKDGGLGGDLRFSASAIRMAASAASRAAFCTASRLGFGGLSERPRSSGLFRTDKNPRGDRDRDRALCLLGEGERLL